MILIENNDLDHHRLFFQYIGTSYMRYNFDNFIMIDKTKIISRPVILYWKYVSQWCRHISEWNKREKKKNILQFLTLRM